MRFISLMLILLFAAGFTACSFAIEFVVINKSDQPVKVQCKVEKDFGNPELVSLIGPLSMTNASQLSAGEWRELSEAEYRVDRESRTIIVSLMPGQALLVKRCHDSGISFPIEEISINGGDGEMRFQGEQAFKAFVKQTDRLFTLTYR